MLDSASVDDLAAILWRTEAEDAGAPASIAEGRTRTAFDEQSDELKKRWRKFSRAALSARLSTITPAEAGGRVGAHTEARAIALPATKPFVDRLIRIFNDHPHDDTSAVVLREYAQQAVATALAAKDAELAAERDLRIAAENDRDRFIEGKVLAEHQRDTALAQLAEANKALERHRSERSYVVGWNDGFAHAASEDLKFPTMLRKMWSGGEVQAWLDEQFAARRAREQGGE